MCLMQAKTEGSAKEFYLPTGKHILVQTFWHGSFTVSEGRHIQLQMFGRSWKGVAVKQIMRETEYKRD